MEKLMALGVVEKVKKKLQLWSGFWRGGASGSGQA
jgi:hypothetical protein